MKRYTFELEIIEGSDEFWEEETAGGKTGCDAVFEWIKSLLEDGSGLFVNDNFTLKLIKFEDK